MTLLGSINDQAVCDVSFLASGSTTPTYASRAILASRSRFFDAMFRGDWAESVKSSKPIRLTEWTPVALAVVLLHLYTGLTLTSSVDGTDDELAVVFKHLNIELTDVHHLANLTNCFEIVGMLECNELAASVRDGIVCVLNNQIKALKM
ncbi:hypothetical protein H9P43_007309 [Blastocladiella emersonii ATCC 22665]|nr:hypothetical protein H9P43_007309 [Blastocladiella emersonii ATCC 22665]